METIKIKALGMEGDAQEPASVDEFDTIAKKTGACLQRAREYVRYHITMGDVRELFLHGREGEAAKDEKPAVEAIQGVEEITGIKRKTTPVMKNGQPVVKDGETVTEYDETEGKYFDRVLSTLVSESKFKTEDEAKASFQDLFNTVLTEVGFPAEKKESKASGPKKLAAKYKLAAAKVITVGTVDKVNAVQLAQIGKTFTATDDQTKLFTGMYENADKSTTNFSVSDKDAEALGWLLKEYFDWKQNQEVLAVA